MEEKIVRDLTIPGDEYVTLSGESNLMEAIMRLGQKKKGLGDRGHTSIIVTDSQGNITSLLTMFDIMRGLEAQYQKISHLDWDRFGYGEEKLEKLFSDHGLWLKPLEDLCARVSRVRLADMSLVHCSDDRIAAESSLDDAIHKMIQCRAHNLLVFEGDKRFMGVLRTVDLFNFICSLVETCSLHRGRSGGE